MIHLNLGSNLGERFNNITIAVNLLIEAKIKVIKISNFYETPSYPNQNLPKYLNVGILANYANDHFNLFKKIKLIEKKMGRKRSKKNDPRIIDIDIVDFKKITLKSKDLVLPHPKCHQRNFVLYPILQIDNNWSHPVLKKNVQYMINKLNQKSRIEITRLQKNVNIQI